MIRASSRHLEEAGKSYWPHCTFAVKNGFILIWVGVISVLHGLCPAFMPFYSRNRVIDMARRVEAGTR